MAVLSGFLTGLKISPPLTRQPYIAWLNRPLHFLWWKRVFLGKVGSLCVSSTGNVEVKEQDGISFKTPRSLSSVTLLGFSKYRSFPVANENKSFRPLETFSTYSCQWINIYFKVNIKIGSIYFLNTRSWLSSACFSNEEKYIYLHNLSLRLALQTIWHSFLADGKWSHSKHYGLLYSALNRLFWCRASDQCTTEGKIISSLSELRKGCVMMWHQARCMTQRRYETKLQSYSRAEGM